MFLLHQPSTVRFAGSWDWTLCSCLQFAHCPKPNVSGCRLPRGGEAASLRRATTRLGVYRQPRRQPRTTSWTPGLFSLAWVTLLQDARQREVSWRRPENNARRPRPSASPCTHYKPGSSPQGAQHTHFFDSGNPMRPLFGDFAAWGAWIAMLSRRAAGGTPRSGAALTQQVAGSTLVCASGQSPKGGRCPPVRGDWSCFVRVLGSGAASARRCA